MQIETMSSIREKIQDICEYLRSYTKTIRNLV